MSLLRTAKLDRHAPLAAEELGAPPFGAEHGDKALREWCELRAHPRGRLIDGECLCGLIRYDE